MTTAVASPPSFQSLPRLGWNGGGGPTGGFNSMSAEEVSRMFMPQRNWPAEDEFLHPAISSSSSSTSTSTITTNPQTPGSYSHSEWRVKRASRTEKEARKRGLLARIKRRKQARLEYEVAEQHKLRPLE